MKASGSGLRTLHQILAERGFEDTRLTNLSNPCTAPDQEPPHPQTEKEAQTQLAEPLKAQTLLDYYIRFPKPKNPEP